MNQDINASPELKLFELIAVSTIPLVCLKLYNNYCKAAMHACAHLPFSLIQPRTGFDEVQLYYITSLVLIMPNVATNKLAY